MICFGRMVAECKMCREFDRILDRFEQGKPFFLYTGRGPSSDSMHLGHMVPFVFTKCVPDILLLR